MGIRNRIPSIFVERRRPIVRLSRPHCPIAAFTHDLQITQRDAVGKATPMVLGREFMCYRCVHPFDWSHRSVLHRKCSGSLRHVTSAVLVAVALDVHDLSASSAAYFVLTSAAMAMAHRGGDKCCHLRSVFRGLLQPRRPHNPPRCRASGCTRPRARSGPCRVAGRSGRLSPGRTVVSFFHGLRRPRVDMDGLSPAHSRLV